MNCLRITLLYITAVCFIHVFIVAIFWRVFCIESIQSCISLTSLSKMELSKRQPFSGNVTNSNHNTTSNHNTYQAMKYSSINLASLPQMPLLSAPSLKRQIDAKVKRDMLYLLQTVDQKLSEKNIDLVMYFGTLVGSYIMHDFLPWDDDSDMIIDANKKEEALQVLEDFNQCDSCGVVFKTTTVNVCKVWLKDSPKAGRTDWGFPYVDIMFYNYDKVRVWHEYRNQNFAAIDDFFPLHRRPLGSIWLLSPNNPAALLAIRYGIFKCQTHTFDHHNQRTMESKMVPCETLRSYYPFVVRAPACESGVNETLFMNGKPQYSVYIENEPFPKHKSKAFSLLNSV